MDWDGHGDVLQDINVLCVNVVTAHGKPPVAVGVKPSGLYCSVEQNGLSGRSQAVPEAAHQNARPARAGPYSER